MRSARPLFAAMIALGVAFTVSLTTAAGDDFRIDTRVFHGENVEPLSATTTLFKGGVVYDFPAKPLGPWEITIFDPANGRFVLLDPQRKVKTELLTADIESFVAAQRQRARQGESAFMQFLADPEFEESFDPVTGKIELESEYITYELTTAAAASDIASRQYNDFTDGFAKISPVLEAAAPPPFARLVVNRALRDRKLIPDRVTMTARPGRAAGAQQVFQLRSEHDVRWKLVADDLRRIGDVHDQMATFRAVGFDEFRTREVEQTAQKPN